MPVLLCLQVSISTANIAEELDSYFCMGMLIQVGEECEEPGKQCRHYNGGMQTIELCEERNIAEMLEDQRKLYDLYNSQCREVIYTDYSEERVNRALSKANKCNDTLKTHNKDLSRSYSSYTCMSILDHLIDRCDLNMDVSEIPALQIEQKLKIYIYNTRCTAQGEPHSTFGLDKVHGKIDELDACYTKLFRKAGLVIH